MSSIMNLETFDAILRLIVTSQLWVVEETGVPSENHRLTSSHWQLPHIMGFDDGLHGWQVNEYKLCTVQEFIAFVKKNIVIHYNSTFHVIYAKIVCIDTMSIA